MKKNLITEMKFMMERLENPRMTYTEYENKHNRLIKEFEKGFESDTNKEMSGTVLPVESNYISSDEVKDLGIRLKRAFIENGFNVLDPKTSPYWDRGSRGLAVLPKFKPDEKNIFIAVGDTFNGNPSKSNESTEMVMVEFRNPLKNEVMGILQKNSDANTKIEDFYGDRGEISRLYIYLSNNTEDVGLSESFISKITGLEKNATGIYKIDQYDLNDLLHYSVLLRDYPGRQQGTTVVGQSDAEYIDYLLDKNNINARVYLGPRFDVGRSAVSITVVYKTEEDKEKGSDIIKKDDLYEFVPF